MANKHSSTSPKLGLGCAVLFCIPFAAVGVGMTLWGVYNIWKNAAMQSWVEVPAVIRKAELKTHNNEGTSYQAIANYSYEFAGQKFNGDCVSPGYGSDNIGDFQQAAYHELKDHLDQNRPFRCYVNPNRPSEAVLYRHLRGEMLVFTTLFATTFGTAGLALLAVAIAGARQEKKLSPAQVPHDRPWLVRTDWASGMIKSSESTEISIRTLSVATVYWNIATLPLLVKLPAVFHQPDIGGWRWASLVFPTIGGLLIATLLYRLARQRKFGESVLQLASTPGVAGGQLAGVVRIPKAVTPAEGFRLTLTCVENRSSGDNTVEDVLWQDERIGTQPLAEAGGNSAGGEAAGETAVPFLFAIPFECHDSSSKEAMGRDIQWRLDVKGRVPGVDYETRFEVPVFKTSESRPDFKLDDKLASDFAARPSNEFILGEAGIFKEPLAGSAIRLIFPAARNWKYALFLTFFSTIWTGAIVFMSRVGAPVFFPIMFGLFGLALAWGTLDLWLYRSVVDVSPSELTVRGGMLGIGRSRTFAVGDIKEIIAKEDMSSGSSVWKRIVLVPRSGWKRTLAKGIRSKLAIDAIIDELNTTLSLTKSDDAARK